MLFKSVTGNEHITSTIVFEYADRENHADFHLWTRFFESIFGVLTWLQDTESSKEKEHDSRSSVC